jgi:hypothetical protein
MEVVSVVVDFLSLVGVQTNKIRTIQRQGKLRGKLQYVLQISVEGIPLSYDQAFCRFVRL